MISSKYTCLSSEIYPLVVRDLTVRMGNKSDGESLNTRTVILRLGDAGTCQEDEIVRGDGLVHDAIKRGVATVPVRVAFSGYHPWVMRWIWHLIHSFRRNNTFAGKGVYHIDPGELRRLGLEIMMRHEANAYHAISRTRLPRGHERAHWNRLKDSIQTQGFKDDFPIVVLLRRTVGLRDRLLQGHHRLAIAIELGLPVVPVSFAYAGHAPNGLTVIFDRLRAICRPRLSMP